MLPLREALGDLPEAVFADVLESDDAYLLVVDLPGATGETVEVTADGRTVSIEARREKDAPAEYRYVREERSPFLDADLPLPPDADADDATATLDTGVLTLRLPKTGSRGTTIDVT